MRSPVFRLSTAAVLVLAVSLMALLFQGGGATLAFADVVDSILEAKNATYKITTETKGPPAITTTCEFMMLDATRSRQELVKVVPDQANPDGAKDSRMVMIFDLGQRKRLELDRASKTAVVASLANLTDEQVAQRDMFASIRSILLEARDKPDVQRVSLGEKEIDGHRVVGFHVNSKGSSMSLWGDAKTGLPVSVEITLAVHAGVKITMSDFKFNVDMDESLFSLEPPVGYTVKNIIIDVAPSEEKDLIAAFQQYQKLSGGVFPDSLDLGNILRLAPQKLVDDYLAQNMVPGRQPPTQEQISNHLKATMQEFSQVQQRGLHFVFATMPPNADAHYAGKGVSLGADDTPIFWYLPKDSKQYRVIYADLSVRHADTPPQVLGR